MTQPEARLSRRIMKALRDEGVFCFKVWGSEHTMAGLPDVIACVDGWFVGFETKVPGKKHTVSVRQRYVQEQICSAGGVATTVDSVEEAMSIVHAIRNTRTSSEES